jgi:hypothetical protein
MPGRNISRLSRILNVNEQGHSHGNKGRWRNHRLCVYTMSRARLNRSFALLIVLLLMKGVARGQAEGNAPDPDQTQTEEAQPEPGINWGPLLWQSFFFASVENGFRVATQDYTRQAIGGKFIQHWARSIGNLHGWSDGDPFLINYVGHPMQGAVSSFIFVQNDPKYRNTEFGRNREYWKSRMRATLFSFAFSEQFEIGIHSEASIGNAQAYYPQQGFVDHVITPTLGLAWTIAEDSLDKYIIQRFESRTQNKYVQMLLRAGLNPSRSMANAMRLQVPWHRDTRPGLFRHNNGPLLAASQPIGSGSLAFTGESSYHPAVLPVVASPKLSDLSSDLVPTLELTTSYSYFQLAAGKSGSLSCNGGGAAAIYNLNAWIGITADVSGCKMMSPGRNLSGDSITYLLGPRFALRKSSRWVPFAQFLAGGNKFSFEQVYPDRKPADLPTVPAGEPNPYHSLYTSQQQTNAFAIQFGGGLDYVLNRVVALHTVDIEDVHTWARSLNGTHYPNNLRVSTGVSLRFGNW